VDILSELFGVGPNTKTVRRHYHAAVSALGSEFRILRDLPTEVIDRAGIPLLGEAVGRIRKSRLHILGGYDGIFGTIQIFNPGERQHLLGQRKLFHVSTPRKQRRPPSPAVAAKAVDPIPESQSPDRKQLRLNDEQHRAVQHRGGPLILVAGPGTGKTMTLTRRIAHLVTASRIPPGKILAITFTNKAAEEMVGRLGRLFTGNQETTVTTFHSFCYRLLNEQDNPPWGLISDSDRLSLVETAQQMTKSADVTIKQTAAEALDHIIRCKQLIFGPHDDLSPACTPGCLNELGAVYRQYQKLMALQNIMDFEDLIFRMVHRLETDPQYRETIRSRYPWVHVDEYQDINYAQYRLIRALCPPRSNLFVIGDPDQSIYGFRGSDRHYFKKFSEDYPAAAVIHLSRNYRSTGTILDAAYQVVRGRDDSRQRARVYAQGEHGRTITITASATEKQEAVFIGKTIERLIGGTGFQAVDFGAVAPDSTRDACSFADMAVLYRTHSQSRVIEEVFSQAGIPYAVASRRRFQDIPEIDHFISLIKITEGLGGISDLVKLRRVLKPGISRESMDRLQQWCFENAISMHTLRYSVRQYPISGLTRKRQARLYDYLGALFELRKNVEGLPMLQKMEYLRKNTRIDALWRDDPQTESAYRYMETLAGNYGRETHAFLSALLLGRDADHHESTAEKVSLMTVHAAKGLEFPIVFLAGCEDGIMPYSPPGKDKSDPDEERRLFFVAATRARHRLYISWSQKRRIYGKYHKQKISSFVGDIESALTRHRETMNAAGPAPKQLTLF